MTHQRNVVISYRAKELHKRLQDLAVDGKVTLGQKQLAALFGVTTRTLILWLGELRNSGLITVSSYGSGRANIYHIS